MTRFERVFPALLAAGVFFGWRVGYFVNSITSLLLGSGDTSRWLGMFLTCLGRLVGLLCILPCLSTSTLNSSIAVAKVPSSGSLARSKPMIITFDRQFMAPVFAACLVNIAYVPYFFLAEDNEVSVLTVLTGVHSIFPAIWGLLFWSESRGIAKVAGILCSIAAVLLLGTFLQVV